MVLRERLQPETWKSNGSRSAAMVPPKEVCEERSKKFGRVGQYNTQSRDWQASLMLVEKLYPDYRT